MTRTLLRSKIEDEKSGIEGFLRIIYGSNKRHLDFSYRLRKKKTFGISQQLRQQISKCLVH
ncbi:hypothetical protein BD560DRAFT_385849 [Blakeslea trispora]|nr:hypothetical protein BD560DRAFT_385849 [Blakeslea trispora]